MAKISIPGFVERLSKASTGFVARAAAFFQVGLLITWNGNGNGNWNGFGNGNGKNYGNG